MQRVYLKIFVELSKNRTSKCDLLQTWEKKWEVINNTETNDILQKILHPQKCHKTVDWQKITPHLFVCINSR